MKKVFLKVTALTVILCMVFAMSAYAVPGKSNGNAYGLRKNKHVQFLVHEQIMKGDGNGNYFLDDYVNRGAAMVMIVHAFKLAATYEGNFPDVQAGAYFYEAVGIAKSLGIAKGDGQKFNPNAYVTIGQAILMIERSLETSGLKSDVSLSDIYHGDSEDYATRQDIADMLYYVLTGDVVEDTGNVLDTICYSTDSNTAVGFDAEDFTDEFLDADSDVLSYLYFAIPDSDKGVLYYEDTAIARKVSVSRLDDIAFKPASDFSGSVYISYTAYDDEGDSYSGLVKITVAEPDDALNTIFYSTDSNTAVGFDAEDFTDEFLDADSDVLSYLYFANPDSDKGVLYYEDTAIATARKVSVSRLDDIAFKPASDFSGSVYISYIAYDDEGDSYSGLVKITVTEPETLRTLTYNTNINSEVYFVDTHFIRAFNAVDDNDLDYVTFYDLPSEDEGTLYYGTSEVSKSTKYYVGRLDNISFEPTSGFTGSVTVYYEAHGEDGNCYNGTVEITVTNA